MRVGTVVNIIKYQANYFSGIYVKRVHSFLIRAGVLLGIFFYPNGYFFNGFTIGSFNSTRHRCGLRIGDRECAKEQKKKICF